MELGWVHLIVAGVAVWLGIKIVRYLHRRHALIEKYGPEIGIKILERHVWQGMTEEQLRDSWGSPVDIDRRVYKIKTKETWKYNQTGKNRFRDRIYLEDGVVVGWQDLSP